jgi:hypothetical protein
MKHLASSLIGLAASAAFVFPLTINPHAVDDCADPSFHFVMSDIHGTTVPDTTNAKTSYCRVVSDNATLWGL